MIMVRMKYSIMVCLALISCFSCSKDKSDSKHPSISDFKANEMTQDRGVNLPSGIYFYRLNIAGQSFSRKLLLMK